MGASAGHSTTVKDMHFCIVYKNCHELITHTHIVQCVKEYRCMKNESIGYSTSQTVVLIAHNLIACMFTADS